MSPPQRLIVAAILIAATYVITHSVRVSGTPTTTRMPDRDIAELPMQLGDWTGQDGEVGARLIEAVGGDQIVNRTYVRTGGASVNLHLAVFSNHRLQTPHHPSDCLVGAGFQGVVERELVCKAADAPPLRAGFLTAERDGAMTSVSFWYQFDGRVVLSRDDLRRESWAVRGQKTLPPVIKILLTCRTQSAEQGRLLLDDIAPHVYAWTSQVH